MKAAASTVLRSPEATCVQCSRGTGALIRTMLRAVWLSVEILGCAVRFGWVYARFGGRPSLAIRSRCLQANCRRLLRVLRADVRATGCAPARGLLVSNHLSYVDILLLGATAPCVFVAKSDVRRWPVLGPLTALAGTLYIHRERRSDASRMSGEIRRALDDGLLVVLFPEGTSTGGDVVLPFKSSLLGAIEGTKHPLTPAAIAYALRDGDAAKEVCYWRDMTLLPHLWNLLGKQTLRAEVAFGRTERPGADDRKALSIRLHAEVRRLKQSIDDRISS